MKAVIDPEQELLERTLRAALHVDAPGIDEDEARERAERAIARARAQSRRRGRTLVVGVAVAVAATFAFVVWRVPPPTPRHATPSANLELTLQDSLHRAEVTPPVEERVEERIDEDVSSVRLPSGDRLVADPGAHYDVESTSADRRVHLTEGEVLFDVAPLEGGSFTVAAGEVQVRVRGTVFSVRRERHVQVEVFEGSVEVRHGNTTVVLSPGDRWSSESEPLRSPTARATSTPTPTIVQPETVVSVTLSDARALLREREFDAALQASAERDEPAWQMLRADALRGLRRWREAAQAYDDAIPSLDRARRAQASYAAARIWSYRTGDADAALDSLSAGGAANAGSPLEERARVLEINLLQQLGRDHRERAREYLERFPESSTAFELRRSL